MRPEVNHLSPAEKMGEWAMCAAAAAAPATLSAAEKMGQRAMCAAAAAASATLSAAKEMGERQVRLRRGVI